MNKLIYVLILTFICIQSANARTQSFAYIETVKTNLVGANNSQVIISVREIFPNPQCVNGYWFPAEDSFSQFTTEALFLALYSGKRLELTSDETQNRPFQNGFSNPNTCRLISVKTYSAQ